MERIKFMFGKRVFTIRKNKDGKFSVHERKFFMYWKKLNDKDFVNRRTAESLIDSLISKTSTKRFVQPEIIYEVIEHESLGD